MMVLNFRFIAQNDCNAPNPYDAKGRANLPEGAYTHDLAKQQAYLQEYNEVVEQSQANLNQLSAEIAATTGYLYGYLYQFFSGGQEFCFSMDKTTQRAYHKQIMGALDYLGDNGVKVNKFNKGDTIQIYQKDNGDTYIKCDGQNWDVLWTPFIKSGDVLIPTPDPPPQPNQEPINPNIEIVTENVSGTTGEITFAGNIKEKITVAYQKKTQGENVTYIITSTASSLQSVNGYTVTVDDKSIVYQQDGGTHKVTITIDQALGNPLVNIENEPTHVAFKNESELKNTLKTKTDGSYEELSDYTVNGTKKMTEVGFEKDHDIININNVAIKDQLPSGVNPEDLHVISLTKTTNGQSEATYLLVDDKNNVYQITKPSKTPNAVDTYDFVTSENFSIDDNGKLEYAEVKEEQREVELPFYVGIGSSRKKININCKFKAKVKNDKIISLESVVQKWHSSSNLNISSYDKEKNELYLVNASGTEKLYAFLKIEDGTVVIDKIQTELPKLKVTNESLKTSDNTEIGKISITDAVVTYDNSQATISKYSLTLFGNKITIPGGTDIRVSALNDKNTIYFTKNDKKYSVEVMAKDGALVFGAVKEENEVEQEKPTITSSWSGGTIEDKYAAESVGGQNIAPAIKVENLPAGTTHVAVVIYDKNSPNPGFLHAAYTNVPVTTNVTLNFAEEELSNTLGNRHVPYNGPYPSDNKKHGYVIRVIPQNESISSFDDVTHLDDLMSKLSGKVDVSHMVESSTATFENKSTTSPEIEIYEYVDDMPRFDAATEETSGTDEEKKAAADKEMLKYIYENVKYPTIARENGVEGTAVISFVVEKDGSITDTKIIRDPGAGCGAEALRVVKSFPKFTPGKNKGEAKRVQMTVPIKFKLE